MENWVRGNALPTRCAWPNWQCCSPTTSTSALTTGRPSNCIPAPEAPHAGEQHELPFFSYLSISVVRRLQDITLRGLSSIISPFQVLVEVFAVRRPAEEDEGKEHLAIQIRTVIRPHVNPCACIQIQDLGAIDIRQVLNILIMGMPHHRVNLPAGREFYADDGLVYAGGHSIFSNLRLSLASQP